MPNYTVIPCTEADMPRVFEIISLAFGHDHEYMDAIFPTHDTPEGRSIGAERLLEIFHGDPYGHFVKVVEQETHNVVGAAKWNIYKSGFVPPQPEINGDYWQSEEDKEFAQALFHGFFTPRQKIIEETNGNLVALEILMVDPAYQCKGIGRLLVQWGLYHADELGVEASERGRRLYASEHFDGFYYEVPVPNKFADRRKQTYYFMRRPASLQREMIEVNN